MGQASTKQGCSFGTRKSRLSTQDDPALKETFTHDYESDDSSVKTCCEDESDLLAPMKPEDHGKLTVVLDMDETLIHSKFECMNNYRQDEDRKDVQSEPSFTFQLKLNLHKPPETVKVFKRPLLEEFLTELSKEFEVIVFTAAIPLYAKPVLDLIDPDNKLIAQRLYRDATVTHYGRNFVKDISRLGRDLKRTVIVDNNSMAMMANPDNAIPITSFYDSSTDKELSKLLTLLRQMKHLKDVRPHLVQKYQFREKLSNLLGVQL